MRHLIDCPIPVGAPIAQFDEYISELRELKKQEGSVEGKKDISNAIDEATWRRELTQEQEEILRPAELIIDPPVNPMSSPADIAGWIEELRAMEVPAGQEIARARAVGQAQAWLREARRDRGEDGRNGQG